MLLSDPSCHPWLGEQKTLDYKSRPYRVGRCPGFRPGDGHKTTLIAGELETKKVGPKDLAGWSIRRKERQQLGARADGKLCAANEPAAPLQRLSSAARQAAELKMNTVILAWA